MSIDYKKELLKMPEMFKELDDAQLNEWTGIAMAKKLNGYTKLYDILNNVLLLVSPENYLYVNFKPGKYCILESAQGLLYFKKLKKQYNETMSYEAEATYEIQEKRIVKHI